VPRTPPRWAMIWDRHVCVCVCVCRAGTLRSARSPASTKQSDEQAAAAVAIARVCCRSPSNSKSLQPAPRRRTATGSLLGQELGAETGHSSVKVKGVARSAPFPSRTPLHGPTHGCPKNDQQGKIMRLSQIREGAGRPALPSRWKDGRLLPARQERPPTPEKPEPKPKPPTMRKPPQPPHPPETTADSAGQRQGSRQYTKD
jgi:hypothetical protein